MNVQGSILGHRSNPSPNLGAQFHDPLIRALVEAVKGQLAARFVHLLRDASPQIVQSTVKLADLLLIIHSLQSRRGHGLIQHSRSIEYVRDLLTENLSRVNRPNQRSHKKRYDRAQQCVEHTEPCHMPGFALSSKYQDQCRRETSSRECRM